MTSAIKTVDPDRVARGRSIYCPWCGSVAVAESVGGRAGYSRKRVTCTGVGCSKLKQLVEINDQTGEAKTVDIDPEAKLFKAAGRRGRPKGKSTSCAVADCPRQATAKGMCNGHYSRWVSCGRPGVALFIAAGGPTKKQWLALPQQQAEQPPEVSPEVQTPEAKPKETDDAEHVAADADESGVEFTEQAGGGDDGPGAAAVPGADGAECAGGLEQDGDPGGDDAHDRVGAPRDEPGPGQPGRDRGDDQAVGEAVPHPDPAADDAVGEAEPAPGSGAAVGLIQEDQSDQWLDTRLSTLVPLPENTQQVVVGVIGSQLSVLTTSGKVLWQAELREVG